MPCPGNCWPPPLYAYLCALIGNCGEVDPHIHDRALKRAIDNHERQTTPRRSGNRAGAEGTGFAGRICHDHPVKNPVFPHPPPPSGHGRSSIAVGWLLAYLLAKRSGSGRWYILILPFFIYGQINFFTAHIFNALFLEAYGIDGSAVITQSEETSSTLNDQSVWAYDAVMKTAEGQGCGDRVRHHVRQHLSDHQRHPHPATGRAVRGARYIPSFRAQFRDHARAVALWEKEISASARIAGPSEKRRRNLRPAPITAPFVAEYKQALTVFIDRHRDDADPALIGYYRAQLGALPRAGRSAAQINLLAEQLSN